LRQRRCDWPAHVQVVPGPHRTSVSNTSSRVDQQRCVVRPAVESLGGPRWGRNSAAPGGQQRTAGDNESRGQRRFAALDLVCETAGLGFHTAEATGSKPVTPPAQTVLTGLRLAPLARRLARRSLAALVRTLKRLSTWMGRG
jgi:hypothetical protein